MSDTETTERRIANIEYMVKLMFEEMFPMAKAYREYQEKSQTSKETP